MKQTVRQQTRVKNFTLSVNFYIDNVKIDGVENCQKLLPSNILNIIAYKCISGVSITML